MLDSRLTVTGAANASRHLDWGLDEWAWACLVEISAHLVKTVARSPSSSVAVRRAMPDGPFPCAGGSQEERGCSYGSFNRAATSHHNNCWMTLIKKNKQTLHCSSGVNGSNSPTTTCQNGPYRAPVLPRRAAFTQAGSGIHL